LGEVVHITFVATTRHEEKKRQGDKTMTKIDKTTVEFKALVQRYLASFAGQSDYTILKRWEAAAHFKTGSILHAEAIFEASLTHYPDRHWNPLFAWDNS